MPEEKQTTAVNEGIPQREPHLSNKMRYIMQALGKTHTPMPIVEVSLLCIANRKKGMASKGVDRFR